jgi:hypothetical protein
MINKQHGQARAGTRWRAQARTGVGCAGGSRHVNNPPPPRPAQAHTGPHRRHAQVLVMLANYVVDQFAVGIVSGKLSQTRNNSNDVQLNSMYSML